MEHWNLSEEENNKKREKNRLTIRLAIEVIYECQKKYIYSFFFLRWLGFKVSFLFNETETIVLEWATLSDKSTKKG